MRIAMITSGFPPLARGGVQMHTLQLARGLRAAGHEVAIVCAQQQGNEPDNAIFEDRFDELPVWRINNTWAGVARIADLLDDPELEEAVLSVLDALECDLVHVHEFNVLPSSLIPRLQARGMAVVCTLHDHWGVCFRGQRITPELEICHELDRERCVRCLTPMWPHFGLDLDQVQAGYDTLLKRLGGCEALIAPSDFHRWRMIEAGLPADRIRAIEHGLDHDRIPHREAAHWPIRHVGFLGTLLPTKGVHVLVEAFNRLGRDDLELHLHGEAVVFHGDTSFEARLRALARDDLAVHFHGAYDPDELPRILAGLDLVVVPSVWWETFCLTAREAMLAGVPVLASDIGGLHEGLAPLEEDLLFTPGDPQDLVHKMHALLHDEQRVKRLSRLRERVRRREEMVAETEALYRELVGHPERRRAHQAHLEGAKKKGAERPYATVFFPTWNGGELFAKVLDRVLAQECDFDFEVLCIDSGSTDGTVEAIKARPLVRLIEIPNSEFNHGLTRNRGVREARGEIVALLTQDAEPLDERWLQTLIDNFDDPEVAGVYCHQLPRPECNPFQRDRLRGWTRGEGKPERKTLRDPASWESLAPMERYRLIAFDDVASCVRKSAMERVPFAERMFGEDVDWGKRAILAGMTVVMDPRAVVVHSHENPIWYEFKRVYLDHRNLNDLVGLRTVPTPWHVAKFSTHLTGKLLRAVARDDRGFLYKLRWWAKTPLYAFSQNLAQYLGAASNLSGGKGLFGWLDRRLRKGV